MTESSFWFLPLLFCCLCSSQTHFLNACLDLLQWLSWSYHWYHFWGGQCCPVTWMPCLLFISWGSLCCARVWSASSAFYTQSSVRSTHLHPIRAIWNQRPPRRQRHWRPANASVRPIGLWCFSQIIIMGKSEAVDLIPKGFHGQGSNGAPWATQAETRPSELH